jgi:hypothetical protein
MYTGVIFSGNGTFLAPLKTVGYIHHFRSEEVKVHVYKQRNDSHVLKKNTVVWNAKCEAPVSLFKTHITCIQLI